MKKLVSLLGALALIACGEKKESGVGAAEVADSSVGSQAAGNQTEEPSTDTAKPPPAELPVIEPASEESSETPKSLSDADVERLLKEAVDFDSLEERVGLYYHNNEPYSGWTKMMYDSGQVQGLAQFKDGKLDGLFRGWDENGQKESEGTYKDGKADGPYMEWYENGQKKMATSIKDGKWHGVTVGWHENGQKASEGTSDGPYTNWHENGQKQNEGTSKDGKPHGLQTSWYENGQKESEQTHKEGKLDGPFTGWHENGQKSYETTYKDGKEDGLSTKWHENGQKQAEETYKDGKKVSGKFWNSKGEEVETEAESWE
jgi:antitoxin component YwqK of YwqJK toxin-antitoxin module